MKRTLQKEHANIVVAIKPRKDHLATLWIYLILSL